MAGTWSAEQTASLIDLYQVQPILYTVSDPNYHNKFKRQTALEGIVEGLKDIRPNSSVNEIKAKINSLRARFSSELAKSRSKPSGSGSEICKSSFVHLERMLFLQDYIVGRKGFCNAASPNTTSGEDESISQSGTENMDVLLSPTLLEIPTPLTCPATSEVMPRKRKRKDTTAVEDNFLSQASSTLQLLASKDEQPQQDVWDEFGKFVASSLRNLKKNQKMCKHDILRIIMQYEDDDM